MTPKRKKAQERILAAMKDFDPTGTNTKFYEDLFSKLSDKEFDDYMKRIRDKQDVLAYYAPNMKTKTDVNDLIKLSHKYGVELFERIRMYDPLAETYYLTPHKFLVLQVPVRRFSQFIDHKLSVAEGDSRIDMLSGQVVKPDQAGTISQIEVQTLFSRGLTKTIRELIKFRGGDVVAFGEFKRELEEQGSSSIDVETGSVARSAVTMDVLFSGMHLESNISGV